MSFFSVDYFESTPGIIERIVYAAFTLGEMNHEFLRSNNTGDLLSDLTRESVRISNDLDSLYIDLTFEYSPESAFLDTAFDAGIKSVNPLSTENIHLPRNTSYKYVSKDCVANLPSYAASPARNTLEKNLCRWCLELLRLTNWIDRWNAIKTNFDYILNVNSYAVNSYGQLIDNTIIPRDENGNPASRLIKPDYNYNRKVAILRYIMSVLMITETTPGVPFDNYINEFLNTFLAEANNPIYSKHDYVISEVSGQLILNNRTEFSGESGSIGEANSESNYFDPASSGGGGSGGGGDSGSSSSNSDAAGSALGNSDPGTIAGYNGGSNQSSGITKEPINTLPDC